MDFQELYSNIESIVGYTSVSMPMMHFDFNNLCEGCFYVAIKGDLKQEFAKSLIQSYIADKNKKDIMLITLEPNEETGVFDSPIEAKTERMHYDSFPGNIEGTIMYFIERDVFEALYGRVLMKSRQEAAC